VVAVGNRVLGGFPRSGGRVLCVHGSGSFHGRFSELWGARAEQRPHRRLQERRSAAAL